MEEYGVMVDLNTYDLRTLVYFSDRVVKARNERKQAQMARRGLNGARSR